MKKKPNECSEKVSRKRVFNLFRDKIQQTKREHRRRSGNKKQRETEIPVQTPQKNQAHFVVNSGGCLLNGEPFDPNNMPNGVVVIVDQKTAASETNIKQSEINTTHD